LLLLKEPSEGPSSTVLAVMLLSIVIAEMEPFLLLKLEKMLFFDPNL
jgi:hypothetical protein